MPNKCPKGQSQPPKEVGNSNRLASVLMPHLQNHFQQTSTQQDLIMNLLNSLPTAEVENAPQNGKLPPLPHGSDTNGVMNSLTDELTTKSLSTCNYKGEQMQWQYVKRTKIEGEEIHD